MASKLPSFQPVTVEELRRFWRDHPTPDVRRLVLEVERYRRLLTEIDRLSMTIRQAWRDEIGGHLIALHLLKTMLSEERERAGL